MSGQTDDVRIAEAETIAETLQAFVDERHALEAERDLWQSRALFAETRAAEQLAAMAEERRALEAERDVWRTRAHEAETRSADRGDVDPNAAGTNHTANRRRARGNWLDN